MLGLGALVLGLAACEGDPEEEGDGRRNSTNPGSGGSGGGVILDGGGGIDPPNDGAAFCVHPVCNYQTDEGCGSGTTCRPTLTAGDTKVEPSCQAVGGKSRGDDCTSWDECSEGTLCAAGQCRTLCCDGDWSACDDGESCYQTLDIGLPDGGALPSGASLCFPVGSCDVLDPSTCPADRSCQIVDSRGSVACINEGPGGVGEACPCQTGFLCVADACRRLCRAVEGGGEPACPKDEGICVHFDRDPPGVGECTPTE